MSLSSNSLVTKEELDSLLQCPVCYDTCVPPYKQCREGHIACFDCLLQCVNCPVCRSPKCRNRKARCFLQAKLSAVSNNLVLYKLAEKVVSKCKYSKNSCPDEIPLTQKVDHEKNCPFKLVSAMPRTNMAYFCRNDYGCPAEAECDWEGTASEVVKHITEVHEAQEYYSYDVTRTTLGELENSCSHLMPIPATTHCPYQYYNVLHAMDKEFLVSFVGYNNVDREFVHMIAIVQLIGPPSEAQKFEYQ